MNVRKASLDDFVELYKIGENTPELKVSATESFMGADEFSWAISNQSNVFLVAEENKKFLGFIYASAKDLDKPFVDRYACLVYLVVVPEARNKGVAFQLYSGCEQELKKMGINCLYLWANVEGKGEIVGFMKKQGFAEGHKYVWMDKRLD